MENAAATWAIQIVREPVKSNTQGAYKIKHSHRRSAETFGKLYKSRFSEGWSG